MIIEKIDILKLFTERKYAEIVALVSKYSPLKLGDQEIFNIDELSAITHSYVELEDYKNAILWGRNAVMVAKSSTDLKSQKDLDLVLLDLVVCYERTNEPFHKYLWLLKYQEYGFNSPKMNSELKKVEEALTSRMIWVINVPVFVFILITYIIDPSYKHTIFYTIFLVIFVFHLFFSVYKKEKYHSFTRALALFLFDR